MAGGGRRQGAGPPLIHQPSHLLLQPKPMTASTLAPASDKLSLNALRQEFVYPGHPLVLACFIMDSFADFAAASEHQVTQDNPHGFSAASRDARIPGAGCHVGAALDVLRIGSKGGSADEMVKFATEYWDRGRAGGHVNNVQAGQIQAKGIESHFRSLAASWFGN